LKNKELISIIFLCHEIKITKILIVNKMKNTKFASTVMIISLTIFSCQKKGCTDPIAINYSSEATKDNSNCEYLQEDFLLKGTLSKDTSLDPYVIWTLEGRVIVPSGVTLTIPAGTIIKAKAGTGANASSLVIARGGKLMAEGTASAPIVMTSESDDITVGQITGSSLNENVRGLWGGLLVLGNAPGSFSGDVSEYQIEGIPASETNGLYGGNDPADNSGVIQYVSIRHGGAEIGEGNEINGLTLGCVGSGTTIDHIEVVGNVDDGIEFFGGTVNVSELLVWAQGDDGLDIDQAYAGTISNSMVILNSASDHALEIDGPEGSYNGSFNLDNLTIIGASSECSPTGVDGEIADYRKGATGINSNIYIKNFSSGKDIELDADADAASYNAGTLIFSGFEFTPTINNGIDCFTPNLIDGSIFNDKSSLGSTFEADGATICTVVASGANTVGANPSDFSWTYATEKGAF
jgi:hypothetical protein